MDRLKFIGNFFVKGTGVQYVILLVLGIQLFQLQEIKGIATSRYTRFQFTIFLDLLASNNPSMKIPTTLDIDEETNLRLNKLLGENHSNETTVERISRLQKHLIP